MTVSEEKAMVVADRNELCSYLALEIICVYNFDKNKVKHLTVITKRDTAPLL